MAYATLHRVQGLGENNGFRVIPNVSSSYQDSQAATLVF